MALITVIGASGRQGLAQVRQALAAGYDVRAISRRPDALEGAPVEGVERVEVLSPFPQPLTVTDRLENWFTLGEPRNLDLADLEMVLMRQDPPFDMAYITSTHLLERLHPKTVDMTLERVAAADIDHPRSEHRVLHAAVGPHGLADGGEAVDQPAHVGAAVHPGARDRCRDAGRLQPDSGAGHA